MKQMRTAVLLMVLGVATFIAAPAMGATVVAHFDDLIAGTTYNCCGANFNSAGVSVTTRSFQWSGGTWTTDGFAKVDDTALACRSGLEMWVNNINLEFDYGVALNLVEIYYGEYGGNLNLNVNGDFRNFNNFIDIDGLVIGGATVSVVDVGSPGNCCGKLTLRGPINSFFVGGQELWIDDVTGYTAQCFIDAVMQ